MSEDAERETYRVQREDWIREIQGLQEQLAASQKLYESTLIVAEQQAKELAAEREESAKWRSEASKTNELRQQLAAERAWAKGLDKGAAMLREQLDAAQEKAQKRANEATQWYMKAQELELQLAAAQDLMAEVRQGHNDKDSPDYNECDTAPCQWCESSLKLGTDCMDAHINQKTWELKKQLAAERERANKAAARAELAQIKLAAAVAKIGGK